MDFGKLGGTWKKSATATESGRALHGQNGQGRWSAYGLGEIVRWESVAEQATGGKARIAIAGRRSSLREYVVSEPVSVNAATPTGKVVIVENLRAETSADLEKAAFEEALTVNFALYLLQYPNVTITWWRGPVLDPSVIPRAQHEEVFELPTTAGEVRLTVIEWSTNVDRALQLCNENGVALAEIPPGICAPGFTFTAYLS